MDLKDILLRSGFLNVPDDEDADLRSYGLDSLTLVLIAIELEREFGVRIPPEKARIEELSTLRSLRRLIAERKSP